MPRPLGRRLLALLLGVGCLVPFALLHAATADLQVSLSHLPEPVPVQGQVTYTITVDNQGPSTATAVQVTDVLPLPFAFVSAAASQGACTPQDGTVTCDLGDLSLGASATVTVVASANRSGVYAHTVTVASSDTDPSPANNAASEVTTVTGGTVSFPNPTPFSMTADAANPAVPYPGVINVSGVTATVYRITVTLRNLTHTWGDDLDVLLVGPQGQSTLLMSDTGGDNGLTNVTLTFDDAAANRLPNLEQIVAGTYRPTDFGVLSGASADQFPPPAPDRPWGLNLGVFAGSNPNGAWSLFVVDDLPENGGAINQGWRLTIETLNPLQDLAVSVDDDADPVAVGQSVTYSIVVDNHGPASAIGVGVTNQLPSNVDFVSAVSSQGSCQQANGVVTCALGELGNGGSATITVVVTPTSPGERSTTVEVAALNLDPDAGNNTATATTQVLLPPAITAMPEDLTVIQGQTAQFTVTATGNALTYQWQINGSDISGATAATLTLANVQVADAGDYTVVVSNPVGSTTSSPATLTVLVPPTITTQPETQTNFAGGTATFTVVAEGTAPLTYQWFKDGTQLLPGATDATLVLPNLTATDSGSYHVVVTNAGGQVTSDVAALIVWELDFGDAPAPYPTTLAADGARHVRQSGILLGNVIDAELDGAPSAGATGDDTAGRPDDEDGVTFGDPWLAGQSASLSVLASADGVLNAWADFDGDGSWAGAGEHILVDQALVAGPNELTVAVPMDAQLGDCMVRFRFSTVAGLSYTGLATDGEVEDYAVPVTAAIDLSLAVSDVPAAAPSGQNLTFNLVAHNSGPSAASAVRLTNQLPAELGFVSATPSQGSCQQDNGVVWCDLGTLSASNSATVAVTVLPATAGVFNLQANVAAAETEDNPDNNAASATVPVLDSPQITAQPQSLTATNGDLVILTVTAAGTALDYQWRFNGTDLPGATSAALTLNNVQSADAGDYTVQITNAVGAVMSDTATLTVLVPPAIVQQPLCRTALAGESHTFTVVATGDPAPAYQWLKDGLDLPGQTSPALDLVNLQAADAGAYQVVVANAAGAVTSAVARLRVRSASDPAYPDPLGGWTYVYTGDSAANADNAALDGTWTHDNSVDSWAGDGRGAGVGPAGGVSAANGVLTVEDAVNSGSGNTSNRRINFMRNVLQDAVPNADTLLDDGVTLSFRLRLTPPPPADPLTELAGAPNGLVNNSSGKGMIGLRQAGNGGRLISFSLNQAVEDTGPTTTFDFGQAGLHMNNLFGNSPNAFVDPGDFGTVNLLPLDPTQYHQFWITIEDNGADPGTHRVSIYLDGNLTPTTFNVTAGPGVDTAFSDPTATNYLALGLGSTAQVGAFDLDFLAYKPGVVAPEGFDQPVSIGQQPADQIIAEGGVAQFHVEATGSPPLTYQWFKDGVAISGATSDTYTTTPVTPGDDGAVFTVVVDSFCGSLTSDPAVLHLLLPPQIVAQPQSLVVTNGDAASFSVSATGEGVLAYQWRFGGVDIPGATAPVFSLASARPADAGDYDVAVSNSAGSVISSPATLTVQVMDYGDAPAPYPTLAADNGARHVVGGGLFLGAGVDFELTGQPDADATGDDLNGDDEDGVTFTGILTVGQTATVEVLASGSGFLDAWMDFDGNGSWADAGEQLFAGTALTAGLNQLNFPVPLQASASIAFARFRFSSVGGLSLDGPAGDGEVEDYAVPVTLLTDLGAALMAGPDPVASGSELTYAVTVNNAGPSPASGVVLTDVLPPNVTLISATASQGSCQNNSGTVNCALGLLPASGVATVELRVTPTSAGPLANQVTVAGDQLDPQGLNNQAEAQVEVLDAPSIVTPPSDLEVNAGETAQLTVVASGSALAYQWRFNGADLPGETAATLTFPAAQFANQGAYTVQVTNAVGSVESAPATLTVRSAPIILAQPASQTNYSGNTVVLNVEASGTTPLVYQWYYQQTNLLTAGPDASLTLANVTPADSGEYQVVVTNEVGTTASDPAVLTVLDADFGDAPDPAYPTRTAQNGARHLLVPGMFLGASVDGEPDGLPEASAQGDDTNGSDDEDGVTFTSALVLGQPTTLQVVASTDGFLNAWVDFNGNGSWGDAEDQVFHGQALAPGANDLQFTVPVNAVPGPTFARFRFSSVASLGFTGEAPDGEVEDLAVTVEAASDLAVVQVALPNPVEVGHQLTLAITVNNLGPSDATDVVLTDPLPADVNVNEVLSSQGSCLVNGGLITCELGGVAEGGSAAVTVRLAPQAGGPLTNAVTVAAAEADVAPANNTEVVVVQVQAPPEITGQPQSQVIGNGATATFTVAATGTALEYEWTRDGAVLPGETSATLVVANAQLAQAGTYRVRVFNAIGEVLSAPAELTVLAPPTIQMQPQDQTVGEGTTAVLSVTASGTEPLSYQWFFNGAEFIGGVLPTLTLPNVTPFNAGTYTVRITNAVGSVTSAPATLTIITPPQITAQPASQTNIAGTTAQFSVTATGTEPLRYQWYSTGTTALADETNATLTLANVQASQAGDYHVEVSNDAGQVVSATAVLTVWELDLGDAPDPDFPTLLANNGAAHIITAGVQLGAAVDWETDGHPDALAAGDDQAGQDDEDGVELLTAWYLGQTATVRVVASTSGFLDAWMDYNHNGTWADFGEKIFDSEPLTPGINDLVVPVPATALTGEGAARFRFSTGGGLSFDGLAADGEVEDYLVTIDPAVDLAVGLIDKVKAVPLGQDLTYRLGITNYGVSPASSVILSNVLPVDVTLVSTGIGQGSCSNANGTVVCDLGTLDHGQGTVATLVVTPLFPGGITNQASVSANQFDVDTGNNVLVDFAAAVVARGPFANTNLLQVADNGTALIYPATILVSGLTASVYKVTVTLSNITHTFPDDLDVLLVGPRGQTVVLMSDTGGGNTLVDTTLTFDDDAPAPIIDDGLIAPGAYQPANYGNSPDVYPPPAPAGPYGETLSVFFNSNPNGVWSLYVVDDAEEDLGQIVGGWSLSIDTLSPIADLELAMTDSGSPAPLASNLVYTLTVRNAGPAAVPDVRLTNVLSGSATLETVTPSQGSCSQHDGMLDCDLGSLEDGAEATVLISVTPTTPGFLTNAAQLIVDILDSDLTNNAASVTTEIRPVTDVEVIHPELPVSILLDEDRALPLVVTNHGPNPATELQLVDVLPAGFTFVSASATQGACAHDHGVVTCDLGLLPAQATATVTLNVRPDQLGLWTNAVSVSAFEIDLDPANNQAEAVTSVESPPVISFQPQSQVVTNGATAGFGVQASGTEPLTYQWQFNGVDVPGAANAIFTIPSVTFADSGEYRVWISNRVGLVFSDPAVLTVTEPPAITPVADQVTDEDVPLTVFFTVSDRETPAEALAVTATASNPALIPESGLALAGTGADRSLTVTPAPDQSGSSVITLVVRDADEFLAVDSFVLTVNAVNDPPELGELTDRTIAEDGNALVTLTVTDVETDPTNLTLTASASNTDLVPPGNLTLANSGGSRTVTIRPASDAFGSATITVEVTDEGGAVTSGSFLLTVTPVNDPPTLVALADRVLEEDAPEQVVELQDVSAGPANEGQTLTITATSSNPELIPDPTAVYTDPDPTGQLRFTPQPNQSGTATLTVTLDDGGSSNNVIVRTFTVTVNAVNDLPVISGLVDVTIDEDTATSALPFTVGDVESAVEDLVLAGRSSAPEIVPDTAIVFGGTGSNRTVTVTPLPDAFGEVTITVSATDPDGGEGSASFLLTINPINDLPALSSIADQVTDEDVPLEVPFVLFDPETPPERMVVTATPANQTLLPVTNLSFAVDGGSNWTLTIRPQANRHGQSRLAISAIDSDGVVVRSLFNLTVRPVNDPPTLDPIANVLIDEDAPEQVIALTGISGGPPDEEPTVTLQVTSDNPDIIPTPALTYTAPAATAELRFTPLPNTNGIVVLTVIADDGQATNNLFQRRFRVVVGEVDDAPMLVGPPDQVLPEDSSLPVDFNVDDFDTPLENLVLLAESSHPELFPAGSFIFAGEGTNRTVLLQPAPDHFGTATITLSVTDGTSTNAATFNATVESVNDAPTLDALANVTLPEDAGPQTVPLTGISTGAGNEADPLTVTVASSNPALIPDPQLVYTSPDPDGALQFQSATNAHGQAVLTVTIDDGQPENNVTSRSFTVTVQPVNDPPILSPIADQLIAEDTATGALPFVLDDAETPVANLTLAVQSSNPELVPVANVVLGGSGNNRTVTVTPRPERNGSTIITLTATDADNASTVRTFAVTVAAVNDPPTIAEVTDQVTDEDNPVAVNVTIGDQETSPAELVLEVFSSNPTLTPPAGLTLGGSGTDRTLTIAPAADQVGSATLTLAVTDTNGQVATASFVLTVTPVNDPPTLDPVADLDVDQNAGPQTLLLTGLGSGAPDEAQTLAVTAASSDPALVPDPVVDYTAPATIALLRLQPAADATGSVTMTITVDDGAAGNNLTTATFTVTVHPVNEPPAVAPVADQTTLQDTPVEVPLLIGDAESATDDLTLAGVSSDLDLIPAENIVFGGSGSNRTVTLTPAPGAVGVATVTVTVSDPDGGSATTGFLVAFEPVNEAPAISSLTDTNTPESTPLTVEFSVGDRETPADNLLLSASSSDPVVVLASQLGFGGSGSNRTLTITPTAHRSGSATVTVTVQDDRGLTASSAFLLTVTPTNDPPTLSSLPDVTMPAGSTLSLPVTVGDAETPAGDLTLIGESSDAALIADSAIVVGGSGANRTITLTPNPGQTGTATITLTIQDGQGGSDTDKFDLTVVAAGEPPRITRHPVSQTHRVGARVLFSVEATGAPPLRYQWQVNGANLPDATNAALVLNNVQADQAGAYRVVVADAFGNAISETAVLTVEVPPAILTQPHSQTNAIGADVQFVVTAVGDAPLSYQWWFNGAPRPGADTATLAIGGAQAGDAGDYFVVVSNRLGQINSEVATLTLRVPPTIATPPASLTVTQDHAAVFSVVAGGDEPLRYQWFFNDAALPDADGDTLTLPAAQTEDAGDYLVVVSSDVGAATSEVATLTVLVPPAIVLPPASLAVLPDETIQLELTASGTEPLAYQWQFNSVALTNDDRISGADAARLVISNALPADAGDYTVVVSNAAGAVTSAVAVVSVNITPSVQCPPAKTVECGEPWDFDAPLFSDEAVFDSLIFDNSVNDLLIRLNAGTNEVGDEIVLEGAARHVTRFICEYWGTNSQQAEFAGDVRARVRFYANDGPLFQDEFPSPGTVLYDSGEFAVPATPRSTLIIEDFYLDAVVPLTNAVPESFTWTVQFTGMTSNDVAGVDLFSPPVVGQDYPDYWLQSEGSWQLLTNELAAVDFAARIDAAETPVEVNVVNTVTNAACGNTLFATRTWQLVDPAGTTNWCSQTVTVLDTTPPALACAADKTVECGQAWDFDPPTASDACGTVVVSELGTVTNAVSDAGLMATRTWLAADQCGNTATCAQTVTVRVPPVITVQPASVVGTAGADASFITEATGPGPLVYQWYFNGTIALPDATNATLVLSGVQAGDAGDYTVVVTNECGAVTSAPAVLTVTEPPTILEQPVSLTVTQGQDAVFTVTAGGGAPLAYQWWLNGLPLSGATSATLAITNVQPGDAGDYGVVVSNPAGAVTSDPATLTVGVPPQLRRQPQSQNVAAGENVRFAVEASGSLPLTYQWRFNGADIPGETNASLVLHAVQSSDAGAYAVRVANAYGAVDSITAALIVSGDGELPPTLALVSTGAAWRYRDTGEDLGTAWREPAFDDSAWAGGPSQLGYGDGDEATVLGFGPDPGNKYVTAYFRQVFTVANPAAFTNLMLTLLRDDGAVVYLNGVEVVRDNMPAGPIAFDTLAAAVVPPAQESTWGTNLVDAALLVPGVNVLAAEVHQANVTNPDLTFDLELTGLTRGTAPPAIAAIADQTTAEDVPLILGFTVSDPDTDLFRLSVSASSDNPALVPNENFFFDGYDAARTVTIAPAANASGTATITLTVSDGANNNSTSFTLTVDPVNDPPTLDPIPDYAVRGNLKELKLFPSGITAGPPDENQSLSMTVVSSVPDRLRVKEAKYNNPDTTGQIKLDPKDGNFGIATVTVAITDNGSPNASTNVLFDVYVHDRNNDLPALSAIADQTIPENSSAGPLPVTVSDPETAANALALVGKSSNPGLVPPANITFGGSGGNRTVTVTPAAGQTGSATISVLVVDDGFGMSATSFTLTVTPVNDPPAISAIADQTVSEGESTGTLPFQVQDADNEAGSLTVTASSSNPTLVPPANIILGGSGTNRAVQVRPASQQSGTATITLTVSDGQASASESFDLTVIPIDDAPAISDIPDQVVDEDGVLGPIDFFIGDVETPAANLGLTALSSDGGRLPAANIVFGGSGSNRTVTVTPAPDQFGNVRVTLTVTDQDDLSSSDSFLVNIRPVNDPPTLDPIADLTLNLGAGEQTVMLTGLGSGSPQEDQVLALSASSSDPMIIPDPRIDYTPGADTATLSFAPVPGATGTATLTVGVNDGQAADNLTTQSFDVTVSQLLTISAIVDQSMDEDGMLVVPFTVGGASDPTALVVTAASMNPALLAPENVVLERVGTDWTATLTPLPDQFGYATIRLTAADTNGFTAGTSFLLVVQPVNDPPTLDALPDLALAEDSAPVEVPLTGIGTGAANEAQFLVVRATSSDPAVVAPPQVTYVSPESTGTLTLTLVTNGAGSATIEVSVNDLQSANNLATASFLVTVTGENDPPAISDIADQVMTEDGVLSVAFTLLDAESDPVDLVLGAASSDTTLLPAEGLVLGGAGAQRLLTITPAPDQTGTTTITLTATDPDNAESSISFELTVEPANDLPSISSVPNQVIVEDTVSSPIEFTVDDTETAADQLVLTAAAANTNLVQDANLALGGAGNTRTLTITPEPDATGSTLITLTVSDETGGSAQTVFQLTVTEVNDPPTIQAPAEVVMDEDTTAVVNFTVADAETAAGDLLVTVQSSNPALAPVAQLVLGGSNGARTLAISPLIDQFGAATITLTVQDAAGATAQTAFELTVNDVSDVPVIVAQPQDQIASLGGTATFEVVATGSAHLEYQWQFNGLPLEGQTLSVLVVADVQLADVGEYSVVVTSPEGSVTSAPAHLQILVRPEIVRIAHTGAAAEVSFTTMNGLTYTVEYTTSLADPTWLPLTGVAGDGSVMSVVDPEGLAAMRFYRIRVD